MFSSIELHFAAENVYDHNESLHNQTSEEIWHKSLPLSENQKDATFKVCPLLVLPTRLPRILSHVDVPGRNFPPLSNLRSLFISEHCRKQGSQVPLLSLNRRPKIFYGRFPTTNMNRRDLFRLPKISNISPKKLNVLY